jgi:hypothetical protein
MSITPSVYAKARSEIIALFGWNAESLTPDQTLRMDCAVALRLALDDLQGRVVRGESIDVSRMLTASEALARLLPPAVLATPPPEHHRDDRRQVMWQIYKQMRERGELPLKGERGDVPSEGHSLVESVPSIVSDPKQLTPRVDSTAIDVPTSDIVPPGERAECDAGTRPGPDDPPRRSPPIIDAPAAPAAPQYDYSKSQDWKNYVLPSGEITPTPFGGGRRYWGPVGS